MASRPPQPCCTIYSPRLSDIDPDYTRRCPMDTVVQESHHAHSSTHYNARSSAFGRSRLFTKMSNTLRKLRITFSVLCGIVCLMLIVLWLRSYWWWDGFG